MSTIEEVRTRLKLLTTHPSKQGVVNGLAQALYVILHSIEPGKPSEKSEWDGQTTEFSRSAGYIAQIISPRITN